MSSIWSFESSKGTVEMNWSFTILQPVPSLLTELTALRTSSLLIWFFG